MSDKPFKIAPRNLSAQLSYRGRGNPPVAHPSSAISNCFPGLEFDFRAIWRRAFVGIVLSENNNYVVEAEDFKYQQLVGRRLLKIEGNPVAVETRGPIFPGRIEVLTTASNPDAVAFLEWSNTLALIHSKQGHQVACEFTTGKSDNEVFPGKDGLQSESIHLEVRHVFELSPAGDGTEILAVLAEPLAQPGELTQGLCSPWQNDYRECACYYWAASRPDYVNVVPTEDGLSRGDNWMQRQETGTYLPDNRDKGLMLSYDDLFKEWERLLKFVVEGRTERRSSS